MIVLIAAFVIAALLTLVVDRQARPRDRHLRAIGWSKARVVRQLLGETLGIAIVGGALGILAGFGVSEAVHAASPSLKATTDVAGLSGSKFSTFFGQAATASQTTTVKLSAPLHTSTLLLGLVFALIGGLFAGPGRKLAGRATRAGDGPARPGMTMTAATNGNGASGSLYELRDVERSYRTGGGVVRALREINLSIAPGEFLAVEGPSGSGKSTLLQLLGALDRPTGGSLVFDGRELSDLGDRDLTRVRSRDIGFVFQSFNLIPTLSAAENVETAMVPIQHDRRARRARTAELLEQVGLSERAAHLPSRLSGGEQQRVAIAARSPTSRG